ncbi:baseplate J/gp47 family protein [Agrobacterium sp. SHOUNA12C]|nr:baseplate J/gp47 family protein [Agrobacterium sp. BETTINA12B]MCJ9757012.1 baseplate J/gp47 family protein [Agrobacterium sp. SHOUNA12C]
MPWPIQTAKVIVAKMAGSLEAAIIALRPDVRAIDISNAVRSARGTFAQILRVIGLEIREIYDHQSWLGRQMFIDTAEEEYVLRHASIWGVGQRAAIKAVGSVLIEGISGTTLPAGIELSSSTAVIYVTTAAATIASGGTVIVVAEATEAGADGNLEAGIQMTTVTAYPTISKVTVAAAFVGGAAEEDMDELRASTQTRIRQPPHGGAAFDYPVWVGSKFSVKAVSPIEGWIGRGSVGVVVIMKNDDGTPRAPSAAELTAIGDYLGPLNSQAGVRPVTANVIPVAGVLQEITPSVRLRPDTTLIRAAVQEAWERFVLTIGDEDDDQNASPIGALIEPSRISEAISAANGEYAHDLVSPAAPFTLDRTHYPTAGLINFVAA